MATKTKAKKAAPKKAAKKAPKKKAAPKKRSEPQPKVQVPNHGFPPGTKVGFLPTHKVGIERSMNREPFSKPIKTATVAKDGTLEVAGLEKGEWCAAGPFGSAHRYFAFSVK